MWRVNCNIWITSAYNILVSTCFGPDCSTAIRCLTSFLLFKEKQPQASTDSAQCVLCCAHKYTAFTYTLNFMWVGLFVEYLLSILHKYHIPQPDLKLRQTLTINKETNRTSWRDMLSVSMSKNTTARWFQVSVCTRAGFQGDALGRPQVILHNYQGEEPVVTKVPSSHSHLHWTWVQQLYQVACMQVYSSHSFTRKNQAR